MKKSMLTLVGCALAAGTVMAAEVVGNNTAVVIQKEPVVSKTLYQFLIVPVKPFDITNSDTASTIPLNELLPPAGYEAGTRVYSATDASKLYIVAWYDEDGQEKFPMVKSDDDTSGYTLVWATSKNELANNATFSTGDILWLQTASKPTDPTVFCGELSADKVVVDDENNTGMMIPFGNATSEAISYDKLTFTSSNGNGKAEEGDTIYVLEADTTEYTQYVYQKIHASVAGTKWNTSDYYWTKPNPEGFWPIPLDEEKDVMPAGAAAYYYKSNKSN